MSTPFLGEIRTFSFNFNPRGWAQCNGQTLSIQQNAALFAILGTTYGGNGQNTFGLPNLQGRVPISTGNGVVLGQTSGEMNHNLLLSEMPGHTHTMQGAKSPNVDVVAFAGNYIGSGPTMYHTGSPNAVMNGAAVTHAGGNQPHNNMQPYLVVNMCIALQGLFPTRS